MTTALPPELALRPSRDASGARDIGPLTLLSVGSALATHPARRASWRALLSACGAEVREVELYAQAPDRWHGRTARGAVRTAIGDAHPAVIVGPAALLRRLQSPGMPVVFDVVGPTAARRLPRRPASGLATVTASWSDARDLGARWVPVVAPGAAVPARIESGDAPFDLVALCEEPEGSNLEALRSLAWLWPRLCEVIPDISCVVAGPRLGAEARELATTHGWALEEGIDVASAGARAKVGVLAPHRATGPSDVVVQAAAAGLALVVSPAALDGLAPGFPAVVVATREHLVASVRSLLAEPRRRSLLAANAQAHVAATYGLERWVPVVRALLAGAGPVRAAPGGVQASEPEMASANAAPLSTGAAPIDT